MEKLVSSQVGSFYPCSLKCFLTFSINLQVFHQLTTRFEREKTDSVGLTLLVNQKFH